MEASLNHSVLSDPSKLWLVCEQLNRKTVMYQRASQIVKRSPTHFPVKHSSLLYLKALLFNQSMRSLCFWCELISSDLLLMYIKQFQGQQDKVTSAMLSQEMDLYSSKIILTHTRLFIRKKKKDKLSHLESIPVMRTALSHSL